MKEVPMFEARSCPICGETGSEEYLQIQDHWGPDSFSVKKCRGCAGLYLSPAPDRNQISSYYENVLGSIMRKAPNKLFKLFRNIAFRKEMGPLLKRVSAEDRVLDIGTGDGYLAAYISSQGKKVVGFDFYPTDQWIHSGIEYRQADLNNAEVYSGTQGKAAIFRHVLEHLHEPVQVLEALHRSGCRYVFIVVPNVETIMARLFGTDWASWDPPRHLQFFSGKSLDSLLSRAGYRRIELMDHGIDDLVVSLFRRQMLRWRNANPGRDLAEAQQEWWYPWLEPKSRLCAVSAALSSFTTKSVLCRLYEIK